MLPRSKFFPSPRYLRADVRDLQTLGVNGEAAWTSEAQNYLLDQSKVQSKRVEVLIFPLVQLLENADRSWHHDPTHTWKGFQGLCEESLSANSSLLHGTGEKTADCTAVLGLAAPLL